MSNFRADNKSVVSGSQAETLQPGVLVAKDLAGLTTILNKLASQSGAGESNASVNIELQESGNNILRLSLSVQASAGKINRIDYRDPTGRPLLHQAVRDVLNQFVTINPESNDLNFKARHERARAMAAEAASSREQTPRIGSFGFFAGAPEEVPGVVQNTNENRANKGRDFRSK